MAVPLYMDMLDIMHNVFSVRPNDIFVTPSFISGRLLTGTAFAQASADNPKESQWLGMI
jgi:hypothetical protein